MDKREEEIISQTKVRHTFTCDVCGETIGETVEDDDGAYTILGDTELNIYISGSRLRYKKHLCDSCRETTISQMRDALINIGFEEI